MDDAAELQLEVLVAVMARRSSSSYWILRPGISIEGINAVWGSSNSIEDAAEKCCLAVYEEVWLDEYKGGIADVAFTETANDFEMPSMLFREGLPTVRYIYHLA